MPPTIENDTTITKLQQLQSLFKSQQLRTFLPILPLLSLKGKPYSLRNHAPFEPLFSLDLPRRLYYKCGRQVAKTTGMSAQAILQTGTQPYFALLFVAPLYSQICHISTNYVKVFLEESVFGSLVQNKASMQSVAQKSFLNGSRMHFSHAFLNATRIRGISVDAINYDEIQDIDIAHIPVIRESMSASTLMMEKFFGTPKTLDNTLQALWEESSQAEWVIKCGCGHHNIPAQGYDLLKMIGPIGPVCAKCGKLINARNGVWVHAIPERRSEDAGYHIPQIIMPMHYEEPMRPGQIPNNVSDKWMQLLRKRDGSGGYTDAKFLNEVLGESCDMGQKLITLHDIKQASVLHRNEWRTALDHVGDYAVISVGVDWGGGGEDGISTTTIVVAGINVKTGKTDCIYTERVNSGFDTVLEAKRCLEIFQAFRANIFCHDYGGAGAVRETLMMQTGLPMDRLIPFMYVRAPHKKMVELKRPGGYNQRIYYTMDKTRSLLFLAQAIKSQVVLLPEFSSAQAITRDLLALIEERMESRGKADIFLITRSAKQTDDFAHALNYACVGLWHTQNRYPDLSRASQLIVEPGAFSRLEPPIE